MMKRCLISVCMRAAVISLFYIMPSRADADHQKMYSQYILLGADSVYRVVGTESLAVAEQKAQVEDLLPEIIEAARHPERLKLGERNGNGLLMVDSSVVLNVSRENCIVDTLSPLANTLRIRELSIRYASEKLPYNEEELVLRLLLGVVFPLLLLVALRMTRLGIRRWEKTWRTAALQWMNSVSLRRGLSDYEVQNKRIVAFILGIERTFIFTLLILLLSLTWFALFPQTKSLATDFINSIIRPMLDLMGRTVRGIILIIYSAGLFLIAFWLNRHLAGKYRFKVLQGVLSDSVLIFPVRIGIWLIALFLFFFPYPGAPRLFAVSTLLIAFLAALIAFRPIIEEAATGIYLNSSFNLKEGNDLRIDETDYQIINLGLVHACLQRNGQQFYISYSRIMKAVLGSNLTGSKNIAE